MTFKPGEQAIIDLLDEFTSDEVGLTVHSIQTHTGLGRDDLRRYLNGLEQRAEIKGVVRGAVLMFVRVRNCTSLHDHPPHEDCPGNGPFMDQESP